MSSLEHLIIIITLNTRRLINIMVLGIKVLYNLFNRFAKIISTRTNQNFNYTHNDK